MPRSQYRLRKPPIAYVIAQVLTSPVEKIEDFAPSIQERLRRMGFPLQEKGWVNQVSLNVAEQQARVDSVPQFHFLSADRESAVALGPEGYALETVAYRSYDDFSKRLEGVTSAISSETQVGLVRRTGLRFINRICVPFIEARRYLRPNLLGLPSEAFEDGSTPVDRSSIIVDQMDSGSTLAVRIRMAPKNTRLPADLQSSTKLHLAAEGDSPSEPAVLLDLDHFSKRQREFDVDELRDDFEALHDRLTDRFLTITTQAAHDEWEYYSLENNVENSSGGST